MDSPFAKLKVVELKEQLSSKGLPTKGLKKDLVERLELAAAADSQAGSPDSAVKGPVIINKHESPSEQINESCNDQLDYSVDNELEESTEISSPEAVLEHENVSEKLGDDKPNAQSSHSEISRKQIDTKQKESSIVQICNFVRPFTIESVKELLSQYGTLTTFWMDKLRSVAFVEYESVAAAEHCMQGVNGLLWPQGIGKTLTVVFSTAELMNAAMNAPVLSLDKEKQSTDAKPKELVSELDSLFLKTRSKPHIYYLPIHTK